jgi:ribosomal protein L22
MRLDMNSKNEQDRDRDSQKIDEVIDKAVENAEARRDLSEDELDDVAGGIGIKIGGITLGLIAQNNNA